ncbi:MAG TPA: hypothetical protein VLA56_16530 [Pseudomonadales bacterium]|nr:hypothetical protein [Pseudomonadales bacterium]
MVFLALLGGCAGQLGALDPDRVSRLPAGSARAEGVTITITQIAAIDGSVAFTQRNLLLLDLKFVHEGERPVIVAVDRLRMQLGPRDFWPVRPRQAVTRWTDPINRVAAPDVIYDFYDQALPPTLLLLPGDEVSGLVYYHVRTREFAATAARLDISAIPVDVVSAATRVRPALRLQREDEAP